MGLVVCKYVPVDVWLGYIKLRVRSQQLSVATPQCEVHVDREEQTVPGDCQQCERRPLFVASSSQSVYTVCFVSVHYSLLLTLVPSPPVFVSSSFRCSTRSAGKT